VRRRRSRPPSTGRSSFPARGLPVRHTGSPGCRPSGYLGGAAAGGSTTRSPTEAPCRPVASRQHDRRRPNSNPPNNFGLLSPKTHQATPSDTRQPASTVSGTCWHWRRPTAIKHPRATWFPPRPRHHPHQAQRLSIESTHSMSAKNYWQTLADTAELADMARLETKPPRRRRTARVGQKLLANLALSAASRKPPLFTPTQRLRPRSLINSN
jgi:hypothetical protein